MTQKQFWEILGKTKNWTLTSFNMIRQECVNYKISKRFGHNKYEEICPVCAVANYVYKARRFTTELYEARQYLSLSQKFVRDIAAAADDDKGYYESSIRKKLLKTCKIANV